MLLCVERVRKFAWRNFSSAFSRFARKASNCCHDAKNLRISLVPSSIHRDKSRKINNTTGLFHAREGIVSRWNFTIPFDWHECSILISIANPKHMLLVIVFQSFLCISRGKLTKNGSFVNVIDRVSKFVSRRLRLSKWIRKIPPNCWNYVLTNFVNFVKNRKTRTSGIKLYMLLAEEVCGTSGSYVRCFIKFFHYSFPAVVAILNFLQCLRKSAGTHTHIHGV